MEATLSDTEGFAEIAKVFKNIAQAEKQHDKRYLGLLENLNQEKVFKKEGIVLWKCRNCDYVHKNMDGPDE